ncbi:Expansin-B4 [Sesamum alatum]|uniref:Expansin-B4 n=1 Tax=Sesamum alatum TaxID=300844 RepID=A0AAE2CQR0_9LAMI|nr:Expansin-B4 [Sesamum alatum]
MNFDSVNISLNNNTFYSAVATWYDDPEGSGSGGACGLENDVANSPYYGMISAGNNNLLKYGKGCGSCYQVKCTQNAECSGYPITLTITDECPGSCNDDPVHFDLSGKAFEYLAKPGQGAALRNREESTLNIKVDISLNNNTFYSAVATWYDDPEGSGSGGACGLENDVANSPYYGLISARNNNLFKYGKGCGSCYQVKCTQNAECSGYPITLTIRDECPGSCNDDPVHFDLSGKAFGYLAKPGQGAALRNRGRINIEYQRVQCYYNNTSIIFKIDRGSNQYYLAFALEGVNGDGEIGSMGLLPSNSGATTIYAAILWCNMES